jgi:hypothetical protein
MKVSELIKKLTEIQESNGDIMVCTSVHDDYWGRFYTEFTESDLRCGDAQPKGPKSGESENAVIIEV